MVFTKQISKLIITSSLFLSCSLALGPRLTIAAEVPVQATSFAKAPYSKLFTTGSVYAVKDKDFTSGDSSVGVFTLWSKNPINNDIQVTINYALHDKYIANPSAYLTGITLMDNNQPLLTINQLVKADSAHTKITRPGYYESFDALWADNFWDNPFGAMKILFIYLHQLLVGDSVSLIFLNSRMTSLNYQTTIFRCD